MPIEEQRQRYLENEIHKITLKMMEGEMVRKKYDIIHDMLKKEHVHYARQQMQLEEVLNQQQKEKGQSNGFSKSMSNVDTQSFLWITSFYFGWIG